MENRFTRRSFAATAVNVVLPRTSISARTAASDAAWSFPIVFPDQQPGDGLCIKHGYACENSEHYPGLLHTGENWYGIGRSATEADVIAVADGEVVYADFDYPGRVVIIKHQTDLYSMYGHLDYDLTVDTGQFVSRGDRVGRPLSYPGDFERSHLHFEIRTFYIRDTVNGDHPSHGFTCGHQCPPGPGYWPLVAAGHPSDLGWLNPTHVIARRMFVHGPARSGAGAIVASHPSAPTAAAWSEPPWKSAARQRGNLELNPGERYPLLQIAPGDEDSRGRSADAYRLWYRIELPDGEPAWVQAAKPAATAVGRDGGPSSIAFDFIPETALNDGIGERSN